MSKDILPAGPDERRRRSRLCALRAVDKLGLLGEGNLLATLGRRPRLRWLADEEGARWAVLAQLGRIGDPEAFEKAVEWALQARPSPEEAGAYVRRLRSGAERSPEGVLNRPREPENLTPNSLAPPSSGVPADRRPPLCWGGGPRTLGPSLGPEPQEVTVPAMARARIDAAGDDSRQFHRGV